MGYDLDLEDGEEILKEIRGSDLEGKYFGNTVLIILLSLTVIGIPLAIIVGVLTSYDKKKTAYFITNKRVVKQKAKPRGIEREEAYYENIEEVYTDEDEWGPWEHNKSGRLGIRLNSGEFLKLGNLPDEKEVESRIKHNL
jgi:hypothetical protein